MPDRKDQVDKSVDLRMWSSFQSMSVNPQNETPLLRMDEKLFCPEIQTRIFRTDTSEASASTRCNVKAGEHLDNPGILAATFAASGALKRQAATECFLKLESRELIIFFELTTSASGSS